MFGMAGLVCGVTMLFGPTAQANDEEMLHYARFRPSQTYYLYVPAAYAFTGNDQWPLFIAIHSDMASGAGDFELWKQYADKEHFILLAPNFSDGFASFQDDSDRTLWKIVQEVRTEYRIDRQHVLICGVAGGAQFAYRFALRYPEFAHTAAVISPGELPSPGREDAPVRTRFYFSASARQPELIEQAQALVQRLRLAGHEVDMYVDAGGSITIPSKAVVDVLNRVRLMNAELSMRPKSG